MGKSKRKFKLSSLRTKSWPTIVGSVDTTLELTGDDLLSEITTKLVSSKPAERHLAADMISSSMANFDNYTDKELIGLIRILSPICLDRVENCRNAATDSLCYLSSISDKVCDLMVGADVMTPLIALFNNFFAKDGFDWSKTEKSELISQIYVNCCRLLTNLCGTSDKAMKILNNSNLTHILINGLKAFEVNIEVSIASVGEENNIPVLLLTENIDFIKRLLEKPIENSSELHLSNLLAFIVINLGLSTDVGPSELVFKLIDQTLSAVCLPQIREFANVLRQFIENEKTIESLKQNFIEVKNLLLAKTVALELITNIISTDGCAIDEEEGMDCDEDMDNSDEEEGSDRQNSVVNDSQERLRPELEKLLLDHSIAEKVGQHLGSVDEELRQSLVKNNLGIEIINSIESIKLGSLTCVHNLVESIPSERLKIDAQIWTQIQDLVFNNMNTINKQLLKESTNTMRALISRNPALGLTGEQLELLCSGCHSIDSMNVKINIINLMSISAQRSHDMQSIEKITALLMAGLQTETDLVIRAELFDALIDIHSEDNKTDSILIKLDLINCLKQWALLFRNEVKKSSASKRNAIVSTVLLNLMPFIKYKQKMRMDTPFENTLNELKELLVDSS